MVEGARLESVYAGNRIEGSNPSPSAKNNLRTMQALLSHFLSHFYRHAGMRWRGLRIRRRDLLSKRIKAAKRNSPEIDKILKKREKPLWYSQRSKILDASDCRLWLVCFACTCTHHFSIHFFQKI